MLTLLHPAQMQCQIWEARRLERQHEIVGIQYLRGIAALAVVVDHTSRMVAFNKYFGQHVLGNFLGHGARGVDLFFLISGFIICVISLEEGSLAPRVTLRAFALHRFTRIIPMMWLAILSYAALRLLARGTFVPLEYLRAFTLFPAGTVQPNQLWTLRHEAIFYLLFAVSFLGKRQRVWILLAWFLSPVIYAALSLPEHPECPLVQMASIITNPVNVEFLAGFAIGLAWLKWPHPRSLTLPLSPFYLSVAAMIFLMAVSYALRDLSNDLIKRAIFAILCMPILYVGIRIYCQTGPADRLGRLLGDASYVIYLFHPHFVSAVLGIWAKLAQQTPIMVVIIGTTVMATTGGVLLHLFVERPVLKLSRSLAMRRASAEI